MHQSASASLDRYYHEAGHAVVALACGFQLDLINCYEGFCLIYFPLDRFNLCQAWQQDPPRTYLAVLRTLAVLAAGNLVCGLDPGLGDADEIEDWGVSWRAMERRTMGMLPDHLRPPLWQEARAHALKSVQSWLAQPAVHRAIEALSLGLMRSPYMLGDTAFAICQKQGLPHYYWPQSRSHRPR